MQRTNFRPKFKKALSLMLAMLMLMSTWVFAPIEVGALKQGNYDFKVVINVTDAKNTDNDGCHVRWYENNSTYWTTDIGQDMDTHTGEFTYTIGDKNFLSKVNLHIGDGWSANNKMVFTMKVYAKPAGTNNAYVLVNSLPKTTSDTGDDFTTTLDFTNKPYLKSITTTRSAASVEIPKTGTSSANYPTVDLRYTPKDQYGVILPATYAATSSSNAIGSYQTTNTSTYLQRKHIIIPTMQMSGTTDSGEISTTVTFTYNGKSLDKTNEFTITDPECTYKFAGNGGVLTSGDTDYTAKYGHTVPSVVLPISGTKDNAKFVGLYSSDKNTFVQKANEDEWNLQGTHLTTSTQITADQTWYAAWVADTYTATFVNYDRTNLNHDLPISYGTSLDKSNASSYNDLEIPTRPDSNINQYTFKEWRVIEAYDQNGDKVDLHGDMPLLEDYDVVGDTTYQAFYRVVGSTEYSASFNDTDGTELKAETGLSYGTVVTPPTKTPTKDSTVGEDYTFVGWISDEYNSHRFVDVESANYIAATAEQIENLGDRIDNFRVDDNLTFIPVFEKTVREYDVTFNFKDANGAKNKVVTYKYGDKIEFPIANETTYVTEADSQKHTCLAWIFDGMIIETDEQYVTGEMSYDAFYTKSDAKFTISFIDANGNTIGIPQEYDYKDPVNAPALEDYTTADAKYVFKGWTPEFSDIAIADIEYTAVYEKKELHSVTFNYRDGTKIVQQVADGEMFIKPEDATRADDMVYTYVFDKWVEMETEQEVTAVTQDLELKPAFTQTHIDYTVEFKDHEGKTLDTQTLHYGEAIAKPEDPTKPTNEKFSYTFKEWSPNLSETCIGDQVYTPEFTSTQVPYEIKWNNYYSDGSAKIVNGFYETPVNYWKPVDPTREVVDGQSERFLYWKNDATGEKLVGGEYLYGAMSFTAVFEPYTVDYNLTFLDTDGEIIFDVQVQHGDVFSDVVKDFESDPKFIDDTYHSEFDTWFNLVGDQAVAFDPSTKIISNMTFVAQYKNVKHTYENPTITKEPTYLEKGEMTSTCACGATHVEEIDMMNDVTAPTGQIQIASHIWTTGSLSNAIVSKSNVVTISTKDTPYITPEFPDGYYSGMKTISYAVSKTNITHDAVTKWETVERETPSLNYNYSITLEQMLEQFGINSADDDTFYVLVKASDLSGNVVEFKTAKLTIDNTPCDVEVTSNSANTADNGEYCVDATVTITNATDIHSIEVNGEEVATNKLTLNFTEAGSYDVKVTDEAGNVTKVKFYILGSHDPVTKTIHPTCTTEGKTTTYCSKCDKVLSEETIAKTEHDYRYIEGSSVHATCCATGYDYYECHDCGDFKKVETPIDPSAHEYVNGSETAPDCTHDGYITYYCSHDPSHATKVVPGKPATGHTPGKWIIDVEATCTENGKQSRYCEVCGVLIDTISIPATDHSWSDWELVKEATCEEDGINQRHCTNPNCNCVEERIIPAIGHDWYWKITKEPTEDEAGERQEVCRNCGEVRNTEEIPALGKITLKFYDFEGNLIDENTVEGKPGTLVDEDTIIEPTRPDEDGVSYTFSYWADENGDEISIPSSLQTNMDFYAVYKETVARYSIVFENYNGSTLRVRRYEYGTNPEDFAVPSTPVKPSTTYYDYVFSGWSPKLETVTKDQTYVAQFTQIPREYSYVFVDENRNVLAWGTIIAGEKLVPPTVTQAPDEQFHYEFISWDIDMSLLESVTQNIQAVGSFKAIEHEFVKTETEATCQHDGYNTYTCDCGYSYTEKTTDKTDHKFVIIDYFAASYTSPGFKLERCKDCKEEKTTHYPQLEYVIFDWTLKTPQHEPIIDATLVFYSENRIVGTFTTDETGTAHIKLERAGLYDVRISGREINTSNVKVSALANGDFTVDGELSFTQDDCTCTCHKDTFWAKIFRFFYGIIGKLTGKISCCNDPDPMYG